LKPLAQRLAPAETSSAAVALAPADF